MSQLRDQLRRARQDYNAEVYPGDLAATLLPSRRQWWRILLPLAGGIAALVALFLVVQQPAAEPIETADVGTLISSQTPQPAVSNRHNLPSHLPLQFPVSPLMPAAPPVNVSLTALHDWQRHSYDEIGPRLREHLTWPGLMTPTPKAGEVEPAAATQQAV